MEAENVRSLILLSGYVAGISLLVGGGLVAVHVLERVADRAVAFFERRSRSRAGAAARGRARSSEGRATRAVIVDGARVQYDAWDDREVHS
jgi:hypothetical protein